MFVNRLTIFGFTIVSAIVLNVYFTDRSEGILYFSLCATGSLFWHLLYP